MAFSSDRDAEGTLLTPHPTGIRRVDIAVFGKPGTDLVEALVRGRVVARSEVTLPTQGEVIVSLDGNTASLDVDVRLNGRDKQKISDWRFRDLRGKGSAMCLVPPSAC